MSNSGLLPLLFFSLTHHTLHVHPSWFSLLSTCTSLLFSYILSPTSSLFFLTLPLSSLTYLLPWLLLNILFLCFHLLDAAPPLLTGLTLYSPAAPIVCHYAVPPCAWRGLEWEFKGAAEGTDCTALPNIRLTRVCPLASRSRDTPQPTWRNTSVGGTCVLASCMDEILCSLWAQMSAAKTEQDRGCDGSTQASLLLSDKKRKHLLAVATHVSTSVFISLKRCSLKKISKKSQNEQRPTFLLHQHFKVLEPDITHADRNTDASWSEQRAKLNWIIPSLCGDIESTGRGGGGRKE